MQIILHVGPHKTGTSSLQHALLDRYGSDEPGATWYPKPVRTGPGHAVLAWSCLGIRGMARSPEPLRAVVARAQAAGCATLVLSSEEFSRAHPAEIAALRAPLAGVPVHVVVTLTAVARRAVSTWQENVKHRGKLGLDEFLGAIGQRADLAPGLAFDLVESFCEHFGEQPATVLVIAPDDPPERLFANFAATAGLDLARFDDAKLRRNRSLGAVEVEIVRGLNRGLERLATKPDTAAYFAARNQLMKAFATPEWRQAMPYEAIALPARWHAPLRTLAERTVASLAGLERAGRIRVVGDLRALQAEPAAAAEPGTPIR